MSARPVSHELLLLGQANLHGNSAPSQRYPVRGARALCLESASLRRVGSRGMRHAVLADTFARL
jgi:hypothetical protein